VKQELINQAVVGTKDAHNLLLAFGVNAVQKRAAFLPVVTEDEIPVSEWDWQPVIKPSCWDFYPDESQVQDIAEDLFKNGSTYNYGHRQFEFSYSRVDERITYTIYEGKADPFFRRAVAHTEHIGANNLQYVALWLAYNLGEWTPF
jgi:hypothetical protein